MLPRLLFVAGMTIGVMAPLIWAAYVSVPVTSTVSNSPQPKSDLKSVTAPASPSLEPEPEQLTKPIRPQAYDQKADQAPPSSEKAKPAPAEDVTSTVSIPPAPEKTLQGKPPQGAPDAPRNEKRRASSKGESTRKLVERAPLKDVPDVVDLYSGPHIIIVCSELTRLQKLRMGCP
jgi:hypothetical protein